VIETIVLAKGDSGRPRHPNPSCRRWSPFPRAATGGICRAKPRQTTAAVGRSSRPPRVMAVDLGGAGKALARGPSAVWCRDHDEWWWTPPVVSHAGDGGMGGGGLQGNPKSSSPCLFVVLAASGGGLAARLRRCPGVSGVSGLRDPRLVSPAATLASLE
jgi:hypothetical protein